MERARIANVTRPEDRCTRHGLTEPSLVNLSHSLPLQVFNGSVSLHHGALTGSDLATLTTEVSGTRSKCRLSKLAQTS